jgi:NosR/NirI family nitrous oxide reductase transcriptional regulator
MKQGKISLRTIVIIIALILLLAAIFYQRIGAQEDTLSLLGNISPDIVSYESIGGKYPAYKLYDENRNLQGYGVLSQASGYGGPITVLTGIDHDGQIINIKIIENFETPMYLHRIVADGYLERFTNKHISTTLKVGENLDAITGATVTAEGIAAAVRKANEQIGFQEFGMAETSHNRIEVGLSEIILILLFILIIFSKWKKTNKLRTYILIFSVFFLGFKLNALLNLGNFASLISGNIPSFFERPFWFILLFGTILLLLTSGINYYCTWLCPFGAVQEGINKSLGIVKIRVPKKFSMRAKDMRLTLTWLALMTAFLGVNPSIASYEPFTAFFSGQANLGQWLIMLITLLLSIFIYKFWCRFFCPAGAILDLIASSKRNIKKIQLGKTKECAPNKCAACNQPKQENLKTTASDSKYNSFFSIIISGYIVLIIITFAMNSGIL